MTSSGHRSRIDAASLICADLGQLRRDKKRHFLPAWSIVILSLVAALMAMGPRADLLIQPTWQLGAQVVSWLVCLVLFPAVGVGLWHPSGPVRAALGLGGGSIAILASLGWPVQWTASFEAGPCAMLLAAMGIAILGVGAFSGAFSQRRRPGSVYWIAAGTGLACLQLLTWICPRSGGPHLLWMHLVPAAALIVVGGVIGYALHRRSAGG